MPKHEETEDVVEEETEETEEEIKEDMESGEKDEEVYTEEGREKLVEDDEIEDWEEGYMEGAEGRGKQTSCAYCGKALGEDEEDIYEREFDGKIKLFCSEEHAQKYADRLEKQKKKQNLSKK